MAVATIPPLGNFADAAGAVDRARAAPGTGAALPTAAKSAEAFRQFESFVLQSFIETMLPQNAESVFGSGTAGSVWKSMLAEKLADQISRSGGIGIAARIAAGPEARTALPLPPTSTGGGTLPQSSELPLSGPTPHGDRS